MTNQQRHRHKRRCCGGRPPAFDRQICRRRDLLEGCCNRLKRGFRRINSRYDKTATGCGSGL
ncbi:hypothetical protein [Streptomyces bobili]|uniref:hypothetical protein n=1 Tax=Streptomyces bobili TaxID=67280 RepID=UPI0038247769